MIFNKKKYLVKNKYLYFFLLSVDFFSAFLKKPKKSKIIKAPKKILISNIGHLGDVAIATSVLPILKKSYPNIKIGFLCSSISKELLENHTLINKIHIFDHWFLNRENKSKFYKFIKHFKSKKKAIKEIKKENYDASIDLYFHFPNSIHLLSKTNVKNRIGFTGGGFTNYLTHGKNWIDKDQHVSQYHLELLKFFTLNISKEINLTPFLKYNFLEKKQKSLEQLPENYILFHIGAGDENKEVALQVWQKILKKIDFYACKGSFTFENKNKNFDVRKGCFTSKSEIFRKKEFSCKICFTGRGEKEQKKINNIIGEKDNCINLCDKLNLMELIEVVKNAKLIITVDSFILHVASAFNIPTVVLFSSINNSSHWVLKKQNIRKIVFENSQNLETKKVFDEMKNLGVFY